MKRWIKSSYVPDMTERYPEGEQSQDSLQSGYEPKYNPYEDDMTVREAIDDSIPALDGTFEDLFVHDNTGVDYYAEPNSLDGIPDYVLDKRVDYVDWNDARIDIWVLDLDY